MAPEKTARRPLVAGNWKMNCDNHSAAALAEGIALGSMDTAVKKVDVAVCPPFVYLQAVARILAPARIALGAQNLCDRDGGAFTGEISAAMLKDTGCTYAICGHSERRHVFGETDETINRKVHAAVSGGLLPILCVGEVLGERENSRTERVVERQLSAGLEGLSAEKLAAVTIAYEPVWAIGTGRTATPQQAQSVHEFARKILAGICGPGAAGEIRILYGGSVKPGNASDLMRQRDVDGLLVGGASLDAKDFLAIVKAAAGQVA
jgi:triosephosphate isomerase